VVGAEMGFGARYEMAFRAKPFNEVRSDWQCGCVRLPNLSD
jgi:hypothetical protein